ncbi:deoxyhypusine synthase isoform X2 [Neofelis nebulosa]|uniref:deoxyhypusine synthase isoform X2 n=1 Tax=Neofelis nebulosa TaxID=61452 RepID=UPI002729C117|nr:deoxyhypusine synthase isoform X2 [Neofelis nebulosa]
MDASWITEVTESHVTKQLPVPFGRFSEALLPALSYRRACRGLARFEAAGGLAWGGCDLRVRPQEHGGSSGGGGTCSGAGRCAEAQLGAAVRERPSPRLRLQPRRRLPCATGGLRHHWLPGHQLRARSAASQRHEKKLEPLSQDEDHHADLTQSRRPLTGCTIFLGYTSNLISSGLRETIRYLVQHNMVDVLVTTAGGVEEDFIKCLAPTYLGDFSLRGKELRENGINRIGNLLVPNDNYCKFEDWLMPILDQMVLEQNTEGVKWTPSKMIARLGKEINNPESVYYWAQKNHIPVLSPALTDGSLGDMIFFHSYKKPGLVLDIVEDLRLINTQAIFAKRTGMIILGGGVVKHHIANANLMRNGADYAVYINTAQEFDGSDSGARPDEAVSWGKIRVDAQPVKVYADASLVFPLLVAETFAQKSDAFTPEKNED